MVNDFGDIAIDASLIQSQKGDTLTLSNGCICCSMGGDLFYALSDALDRQPRPDHLVIEASGVADPMRISEIARAEPDLRLDATIALVDAAGFEASIGDVHIGTSVARQLTASDLIVINKSDLLPSEDLLKLQDRIAALAPEARQVSSRFGQVPLELLLGQCSLQNLKDMEKPCEGHDHPHDHEELYLRWSMMADLRFDKQDLAARLDRLPAGLLRLKGFVRLKGEADWVSVQVVGQRVDLDLLAKPPGGLERSVLVAIGVRGRLDVAALDRLFT